MGTKSIFNNLYTSKYFDKLPDFKEKKIQAFTTIVLTLIALSFFGLFAISPTISTIANLQKQSEDNVFVEQKLDQKLANLRILTEKFNALQPNLTPVYNAVPKSPEVPQFMGQLSALASKNDINLTRAQTFEVDLTKIQEGVQKYSTFGFLLEAQGSYPNILAYIKDVTNFQRILLIDSISLSKGKENNADLKLSIRGKTFFKK